MVTTEIIEPTANNKYDNDNSNDNNNLKKMVNHLDILKLNDQNNEVEEISLETESIASLTITTTTDDDDNDREDEREIIRLQYDEDEYEDEYYVPGIDDHPYNYNDYQQDDENEQNEDNEFLPGYKPMDLKGESESDKDLIIYSLTESLQIHKAIVERIQNEKDDMEFRHESSRTEEKEMIEEEKQKVQEERQKSKEKVNKLEAIYQSLLKELENKKLEYRRMESRFHSHIKDFKSKEDSNTIKTQIQQLLNQLNELCLSLSPSATSTTINFFFERWPDMMSYYFDNEELDTVTISLLTEKMLMEIIMHDILQTSIHPGASLNRAFGKIYNWVEKRNVSWATRMRQQITAFVVKQSNEESDSIKSIRKSIIHDNLEILCFLYNLTSEEDIKNLKKKWTKIIDGAIKLNLALKCHDSPPIEILNVEEGAQFNKSIMNSCSEGNAVAFVISPLFIASSNSSNDENEEFLIPANVYCV